MIRLGINIDHIATLRNVRDESYPDPVFGAQLAELSGADNITFHLREDRRHIRDLDVERLKQSISIPLNFEMGSTDEMISIACKVKPAFVCLVPEKREERTTEGGLDLIQNAEKLKRHISLLKEKDIRVSLFVEAKEEIVKKAKELEVDALEFHTGDFCQKFHHAKTDHEKYLLLKPFISAARQTHQEKMQVHFGHGLNYENAHWLQLIPYAEEANIGHAIIARSIFCGLKDSIVEMKSLLNDSKYCPYKNLSCPTTLAKREECLGICQ